MFQRVDGVIISSFGAVGIFYGGQIGSAALVFGAFLVWSFGMVAVVTQK